MKNLLHVFVVTIIIFGSCEKERIDIQQNPVFDDYPAYMQSFLISFSHYKKAWTDQSNNYESWPLGQLWYDSSNKKVCQVYNSRDKHVDLEHGRVLFRNKDEKGLWSKPNTVASWESDKYSKRCHGAGVCSNGDYIALVLYEDCDKMFGNVHVYRSKDRGLVWVDEGPILVDGETIYVSESTCVFMTSTNRLLSYASVGLGHSTACVIYSDDNGVSWKKAMMPDGMGFLEGTFIEMENHTIYCIARGDDRFFYPNTPQLACSYNNGSNWVYLGDTHLSSTDAPVSQIRVGNNVFLIYGDRWPNSSGNLSLLFNYLTTREYENMQFKKREIPLTEIAVNYDDFSYPALIETPNTIQATFYCRDGRQVCIFEMVADKPKIY